MKLKFSANKIKNSREEEKVLERLGQSDFANTKRILLLLRSRLEFRSRSSLSIDEELDWIFYNESRTGAGAENGTNTGAGNGTDTGNGNVIGTGGAMDAIGTSDLEMINNLDQNESRTGTGAGAGNGADTGPGNGIGGAVDAIGTSDLEMIDNLNQNILDLSMVENGQMENVKDQSGASTSGFWILDETVTPRVPNIYPALPSLHELRALCEFCCPCPGTPLAVSMPTAPTSPLPPQPQLVENGQMENSTGQSGASFSGFLETPPLAHIYPTLPSLQLRSCPRTPPSVFFTPTAPTWSLVENGWMESVTGQSGASFSEFQATFTPALPNIYPAMLPL